MALAMSVTVVVVDNETEFGVLKTFVVTRTFSQDTTHKPHVYPVCVCVCVCVSLQASSSCSSSLYSYVTDPALSKQSLTFLNFL